MSLKTFKYSSAIDKGDRTLLYIICIILFFVMLCWAIWWFFDYKEKELRNQIIPKTTVSINTKPEITASGSQHTLF